MSDAFREVVGIEVQVHLLAITGALHIDDKYEDCSIWFVICCSSWKICQNQIQYQIFCSWEKDITTTNLASIFSRARLYPSWWKQYCYCYHPKDGNVINIVTITKMETTCIYIATTPKIRTTLILLRIQRWKRHKYLQMTLLLMGVKFQAPNSGSMTDRLDGLSSEDSSRHWLYDRKGSSKSH